MKVEDITVQGIAPWMIWIWIFVGVAMCAVIAVVWKVVQIVREEKKNRKAEIEAIAQAAVKEKADKLAEDISEKVMTVMQDRFAAIDEKLDNDKRRIEKIEKDMAEHEKNLAAFGNTLEKMNANILDMSNGFRVMMRGTLASLEHQNPNGTDEKLNRVTSEITAYLTERPIVPMK